VNDCIFLSSALAEGLFGLFILIFQRKGQGVPTI